MKLDYKILWLDDKISEFIEDEYDNDLKDYLSKQGFNPIILTVFNEEDFFRNLDNTFDLILTDYHLNDDDNSIRNGDLIVSEVRRNSIFTEILFYTARAELSNLSKLDRISFLETRKSTTREHQLALITKVKELIDLTIKKFQHIVAMRGMIMHETSSLDLIMDQLVNNYINNPVNSENVDLILPPIILAIQKNAKEKCDKAFSNKPNKILKDNVLFSASQKIFALGEILKRLEQADFSKDYNKEINWYRNQFAHAEIFVNDEGKQYFKIKIEGQNDELIFDEELCKTIRQNIIKHKENLDKLKSII